MKTERARDIDDDAMWAYRMALRSAVAAVILQLIRERGLSNTEVSGMAGLSRNTIQNVIAAGHDESAPCPRLDTVSDILYALRVPLGRFVALVEEELLARSPELVGDAKGHVFELYLGGHVLRGELRCLEHLKKAK